MLALTQRPARREEPYHIVAEIQDPANLEAARLVGGDEAVLIDKRETIARLIVADLAPVRASVGLHRAARLRRRRDLLPRRIRRSAGKTFGDALLAYEDCSVIGLRRHGRRGHG